ncbi:MAG: carbon-nitrogen hydrolase family protein [Pseudomonadota bacterium]
MVKVAAVQAAPVWLDAKGTLDKTIALIEDAGRQDIEMIAFGETWLPGYPFSIWFLPVMKSMGVVMRHRTNAVERNGPEMRAISEAARAAGTYVTLGYAERSGASIYCSMATFDDRGTEVLHHRKLKPTHMERTVWGEGAADDLRVADTPLGRIGGLCCWENMQPINRQGLYQQGEQIHVAVWPSFGMFKGDPNAYALSAEANLVQSQCYAMQGGCFVLAPTSIITEDHIADMTMGDAFAQTQVQPGGGAAAVFGPDGRRLTDPIDEHTDGLAVADIDLAQIEAAKIFADPAGHYNRPDVAAHVLSSVAGSAKAPAPTDEPIEEDVA